MFIVAYACWAIFVAVWALGWLYNLRSGPKAETTSQTPDGGRLPGFVLVAVAVLLVEQFVPRSVWAAISFRSEPVGIVGLAVLIPSTCFTLWARWTLGTMWSPVPTRKQHHELRTDGAYRVTRHPIYTGIIGMLIGSCLVFGGGEFLIALIVFPSILLFRIPREERLMMDAFGERYARYQREVPRLVPRPRF